MRDAQPVLTILILCGVGLLWLALDLASQKPRVRMERLERIAREETATTLPPVTLVEQARWLVFHRLARLQSLSMLCGVSLLISLVEGLRHRRGDPKVGLRVGLYTLGLLGIALIPGAIAGLLLCPVPWSLLLVTSLLAAWVGFVCYLLVRGVPHVA